VTGVADFRQGCAITCQSFAHLWIMLFKQLLGGIENAAEEGETGGFDFQVIGASGMNFSLGGADQPRSCRQQGSP
jgi:hypothetical protein